MCLSHIIATRLFIFVIAVLTAFAGEPDPIDQLIKSSNARMQREALHKIMAGKSAYSKALARRIEDSYKRKVSIEEMEKLLYAAALTKCEEAIPVLQDIWLDRTSYEYDCIYCCPRSLVMSVLGLHGMWKPPSLSQEQRRTDRVENTLEDLRRFSEDPRKPDAQSVPSFQGNNEATPSAGRFSSFQEEPLLVIATDADISDQQRYAASEELQKRAGDDRLIVDYYWWALNACHDASGECRCFAHERILSAERYAQQKNHLKR